MPPLLQRWYQHTSKHAPNSGHSADASRDEATNRSGIAYTRHELLADWHSYARKISPLDVQWKGKDQIEAQCEYLGTDRLKLFFLQAARDPVTAFFADATRPTDLILKPDGSIEEPQEKLVKQDVIERFGLLASRTEIGLSGKENSQADLPPC